METSNIFFFLSNNVTTLGLLSFTFAFFLHIKKWNTAKYFMLLSLLGSFMKVIIDTILISEEQRMNYFNSPISNITEFLWYIDWIGFALALISIKTTPLNIKVVATLGVVFGILNRPISTLAIDKMNNGQWDYSSYTLFGDIWALVGGGLIITALVMLFIRQTTKTRMA